VFINIGQGRPDAIPIGRPGEGLPTLEALSRWIPPAQIYAALEQTQRHSKRIRKVPASAVVWLMVAIGLWGDDDIPALWRQVAGTLATFWDALRGRKPPSKSALAQARQRLGPRPMRRLFVQTAATWGTAPTRGATYQGMRLLAIDADSHQVPDTPDNVKAFGKPTTVRDGRDTPGGYPVIHVNRLIEVGTHITIDALIRPQATNDKANAAPLLQKARPGDLILWDCGFFSFKLIQQTRQQRQYFLGPVPCHLILQPIRSLSDGSYLAKVYPTQRQRLRDHNGLVVRVLQYTFDDPARTGHGERHRLITSLLDDQRHRALELIVLYHERWEIEIDNDEVTTHQLARPVELRSRTPVGVVQELYGILLAHNAVRALMREAALSIDVDPRTLSFMHAVRLIRDAVPLLRNVSPQCLPELYNALIVQIAAGSLPPRDNRINPRVVKVKLSRFPTKRPHHYHLPQPQKTFMESIVILN
jgi:hypothetical protein